MPLRPFVLKIYLLIVIHFAHSALVVSQKDSWTANLPGLGTFSSPRCIDLNGDKVLDIILGAGREEFQACDSAIIAMDGASGKLLWHVPAIDQIFGSAIFLDVTGDEIPEVFIGGRSAELFCIDGAGGEIIWNFRSANNVLDMREEGWFNFYNPQWVQDQDGDGLKDLLVSNGGDVLAAPHDPNRPPGQLTVVSSKKGIVLGRAFMPDEKETYMSVTLLPDSNNVKVIFGTGGETIGGSLWMGELSEILKGDLSDAVRLDSSSTKGFIGPCVVVDLDGDQRHEIISNAVDGRMLAFDGKTFGKLWSVLIPDSESYSSASVGYFTEDQIPDVFISNGQGVWPRLGWSIQKLIDGENGHVLFTDSLGFYQNTASLAADIDGDGWDEIIMSLNFQEVNELFQKFFYTTLISIDFQTGAIDQISEVHQGSNLSSTPWVGDLDDDGWLDIIYCHGNSLRHTYTFDGMKLHRLETNIRAPSRISWGSYQGSTYTGRF